MFSPVSVPATAPNLDYVRFQLENGLTVIVHEDHKAPVVGVALWYRVGSAHEPGGKTGFAHLFEHLMFSGSENFRGSYFEPFAHVGATDLNGTTWFDRTNYFVTVPTTALDLALWMESDRMGHLLGAIGQPELDAQRGVVQNEKRQNEGAPYGRVGEAILRATYPANHPYHHITIGSMEDIGAASLEEVRLWFNTYYGAANATLVLAGDITPSVAREKAARFFGHIAPGPALPRLQPWIVPLERCVREEMIDRVPHARVLRVWNTPEQGHQDDPALEIAASILGGGAGSRLRKRLVVRDGLAVNTGASQRTLGLAGQFALTVDVAHGISPFLVEAALNEEIERFLTEGPRDAEVAAAAVDLASHFLRSTEKVGGMDGKAAMLAEGQILRGDPLAKFKDVRQIAHTKSEEVRAACARWISLPHYTLAILPTNESQPGTTVPGPARSLLGNPPEPKPVPHGSFFVAPPAVNRSRGVPVIDTYPEVGFPVVRRQRLSNGIDIAFAERRGGGLVEVRVLVGRGGVLDAGEVPGLARFMWTMLMEGADDLDASAIDALRQRLGAILHPTSLSALAAQLRPSLALLAQVLRRPAFRETDMTRVKPRLLAAVARAQAEPNTMAATVLSRLLFGSEHPYGAHGADLGTPESIEAMVTARLRAFHEAVIRPDNLQIFVAGDVAFSELLEGLEATFGDWAVPSEPLAKRPVPRVAQPAAPRMALVHRPGAEQSLLLGGIVTTTPAGEYPVAYKIANGVFGGQFASRLNMNLREDKHWSYGAYSALGTDVVQGRWSLSASVQSDKSAAALAEMIAEVGAIANERPPTPGEIDRIKASEVRTLPARFEATASIVDTLVSNAVNGRPDDYVQRVKGSIEGTSSEQVAVAAGELFRKEAMTWVVVGDLEKIEPSMRQIDIAAVSSLQS